MVRELPGRHLDAAACALQRRARAQVQQPAPARRRGGRRARRAPVRGRTRTAPRRSAVSTIRPASTASSSLITTSSTGRPASSSSTPSEKSRPSTAASVRTSSVSGESRSKRWSRTSRAPSGTPLDGTLRSVSSMKNGLPGRVLVQPATSTPSRPRSATSASVASTSRPTSAMRSSTWSRRRSASTRCSGARRREGDVAVGRQHHDRRRPRRWRTSSRRSSSVGVSARCDVLEHEQQRTPARPGPAASRRPRTGGGAPRRARASRARAPAAAARRRVGRLASSWSGSRCAARWRSASASGWYGHDRLLVRASVEHDRAAGVDLGGEARGQPRLADPRLAGQEHQRALAVADLRPAVVQAPQLASAPDERAALVAADRAGSGTDGTRPTPDSARAPCRSRRSCSAVSAGAGGTPSSSRSITRTAIEGQQRLGDVAGERQRLHQQAVAGLAVGLELEQAARHAARRRRPRRRRAPSASRSPSRSQRSWPISARSCSTHGPAISASTGCADQLERRARPLERDRGRARRPAPRRPRARRLARLVDVDPGVRREGEREHGPPDRARRARARAARR